MKLLKYAERELHSSNETNYFGVTKIKHDQYNLACTFVDDGFRRLYSYDLEDLEIKLRSFNFIKK